MARPVIIKDETIVDAAREVFLERGIQATTAEVAERAGVSEGSVFKRFKSKAELFRAAMWDRITQPDWAKDLSGRVGKGDLRENLFQIGTQMIGFFRTIIPLLMMSWSNPAPNGLPPPLSGSNPPPLRALKHLTGFFEAEIRAGRVRRQDPEIIARVFLGSVNTYVFLDLLQRQNDELPLAQETYLRGLIQLLWAGLEPRPSTPPRP